MRPLPLFRAASLLLTLTLAACAATGEDEEVSEGSAAAATQAGADPRYGNGGLVRAEAVAPESTSVLAHDDEGRLLLLTGKYDDRGVLRAERRLANGALDPSFAKTPIPVLLAPQAGTLAMQPLADGSVVVATSALCALSTCPHDDDAPGRVRRFVFRLTKTGAVDTTFAGGAGLIEIDSPPRGGLATYPIHLARTPGGEIVVAADQPNDTVELRWLDASGRGRGAQTMRGVGGGTAAIAATDDLVFVGRKGGTIDGFGTVTGIERATGKTRRGAAEWRAKATAAPVLRDVTVKAGSVYVVGDAPSEGSYGPSRIAVHKLGLDLVPDTSFGEGGSKVFNAGNGQGGEMTRIAVLADGRVVLAGAIEKEGAAPHANGVIPVADRDLGAVVLRPNGAYDTSFAPRGTVTLHAGGRAEGLTTLTVGPRGVFAAGFSARTPIGTKLDL